MRKSRQEPVLKVPVVFASVLPEKYPPIVAQDQIFHCIFLYHRKLLKPDLAVMPCLSARKAEIGELGDAGTARFLFTFCKLCLNETAPS